MKIVKRFLETCEPGELLDFFKANEDMQLLKELLSRDWKTKLSVYKVLKEAGYGYNGFKKDKPAEK